MPVKASIEGNHIAPHSSIAGFDATLNCIGKINSHYIEIHKITHHLSKSVSLPKELLYYKTVCQTAVTCQSRR